ncbi:MAG: hypothetical protein KDK97_12515, partial [Verrucomicrobiales bacterium]|nr:hypothetical protein [Verrucomicrobiales bacterium]
WPLFVLENDRVRRSPSAGSANPQLLMTRVILAATMFGEFSKTNWQQNEGSRIASFCCLHSPANNHKAL